MCVESKSGHGQSSSVSGEKEKWKQEKSLLLSEIHELKSRSLSPMPALTVNSSATSNENSRTASPDESLESSMLRVSDACDCVGTIIEPAPVTVGIASTALQAAEDSKMLRAVVIPLEEVRLLQLE